MKLLEIFGGRVPLKDNKSCDSSFFSFLISVMIVHVIKLNF